MRNLGIAMGGLPLLDRVAPGDHVCWTVDDDAIRMETIVGFVRDGLRARNKVIYCGDHPEVVLRELERHGVRTSPALEQGLLETSTVEESYLAGGVFDPVATISLWRSVIAQARADGHLGIRVLGDMTWASHGVPGAEHMPWYEAQVNTMFLDGFLTGVCMYDVRRFEPPALRQLGWAHPAAAGPTAPFDPSSSLRMRRFAASRGLVLRLDGEVDLSNRDALASVIGHLFDGRAEATVDVSGLTFADTASVRILVGAARRGGRLTLAGCSRSLLRMLDFHGARDVPGLTVEPR